MADFSMEELEKRTHKDYLTTKKMLAVDAPEYINLAEGDKQALKHLVKAAVVIDKINMQLLTDVILFLKKAIC